MIARYFEFQKHNTSFKTESVAGITTFLTMAYIIFVNPSMLAEAGMDHGAVFVATCLAAAIGCFVMGFIANYPIALAPGMGLNAFFTYGVVLGMGHSWQTALGAVFLSGIIFLLLSVFRVRQWVINTIPTSLKMGIAAGIGAFLALIALKNSGVVVANPATLVSLGDLTQLTPLLSILSFFLVCGLAYRKLPGGVIFVILFTTFIGWLIGDVKFNGIVSLPPSLAPTFMQLDIVAAMDIAMISVVFAFLFVDLFDTSGTLIAVTNKAGLMDDKGNIPKLGRALTADSVATIAGAGLGTSTTTSYVESAAGVSVGGKTGFTAVVTGVLFLVATLFSPLASMVPVYATAGVIFYVAILMMENLRHVDWHELTEAAPVAVVLLMTPLTFSIAHGIALAFITYTLVKALSGKLNEISLGVWILSALFIVKFAVLG